MMARHEMCAKGADMPRPVGNSVSRGQAVSAFKPIPRSLPTDHVGLEADNQRLTGSSRGRFGLGVLAG